MGVYMVKFYLIYSLCIFRGAFASTQYNVASPLAVVVTSGYPKHLSGVIKVNEES